MRCLVMKPASLDMGVLGEILSSNEFDAVLTSEVGAGIDLVDERSLDEFDCGIAVIPAESSSDSIAQGRAGVSASASGVVRSGTLNIK